MTTTQNLQKELKILVANNYVGEVLQKLIDILQENNEAYLHLSNYNEWEEGERMGTIHQQDRPVYERLKSNVLKLIDKISEEEARNYVSENSIFENILIVCKAKERKSFMQQLFPEQSNQCL